MKINVVKKVVSFILVITMLVIPSASFAVTQSELSEQDASIQPRWTYLFECDNSLTITEGETSKLTLYGSTQVYEGLAGVYFQLQKQESDGSWSDVTGKEWEATSSSDYIYLEKTHISVSAGTYRLYLIHSAMNEHGMIRESFPAYSDTITISNAG